MNSRPIDYLRRQAGFTMIELTIVLAVISVVLAGVLPFITSDNQQSALETTAERNQAIHAAIASYAAANNNRLPCPSDIIDALDDVNFGRAGPPGACVAGDPVADPSATADNGGDVVYGGVPVKDIGLSDEYAFDGFGQRISYHVFEPLTVDGALTGSPAGPYIPIFDDDATLEGGGTPREDASVYVLLSHGQRGHGAFLRNGAAQKDLNATSADELENADYDNVLGDSVYDGQFVQAASRITDNAANYFDDIVDYKTLNQVAGAAATAAGATAVTWLANGENIYPAGSDGVHSGATERVGIGTDTPTEFFHVSGGNALFEADTQVNGALGVGTPGPSANEVLSVSNLAGEGVRIGPNANDGSTGLLVTANDPGQRALIARGAPGQTAEIFTVEDSTPESLLTVAADGNVGIGTNAPAGALSVVNDNTGLPQKDDIYIYSYDSTSGPAFIGWRARGTESSPSAVQAGDELASLQGRGWTGSAFIEAGQVRIGAELQDWTTTAGTQDTYMKFDVIRDGTLSEGMRITSEGRVGIGTNDPSSPLEVNGDGSNQTSAELNADGAGSNVLNTPVAGLGTTMAWPAGWGGGLVTWDMMAASALFGDAVGIRLPVGTIPNAALDIGSGNAIKPGGGTWASTSDARLKRVNGAYDRGLDEISALNVIRYNYQDDNARGEPSDEEYVGLLAQEVQPLFPEAISKGKDGYLTLDATPIHFATINAIQELAASQEDLKEEVQALEEPMSLSPSILRDAIIILMSSILSGSICFIIGKKLSR